MMVYLSIFVDEYPPLVGPAIGDGKKCKPNHFG